MLILSPKPLGKQLSSTRRQFVRGASNRRYIVKGKTFLAMTFAFCGPAAARETKAAALQIGDDSYPLYYENADVATASKHAVLLGRAERAAAKRYPMATRLEQRECVRDMVSRIRAPAITRALANRSRTKSTSSQFASADQIR